MQQNKKLGIHQNMLHQLHRKEAATLGEMKHALESVLSPRIPCSRSTVDRFLQSTQDIHIPHDSTLSSRAKDIIKQVRQQRKIARRGKLANYKNSRSLLEPHSRFIHEHYHNGVSLRGLQKKLRVDLSPPVECDHTTIKRFLERSDGKYSSRCDGDLDSLDDGVL